MSACVCNRDARHLFNDCARIEKNLIKIISRQSRDQATQHTSRRSTKQHHQQNHTTQHHPLYYMKTHYNKPPSSKTLKKPMALFVSEWHQKFLLGAKHYQPLGNPTTTRYGSWNRHQTAVASSWHRNNHPNKEPVFRSQRPVPGSILSKELLLQNTILTLTNYVNLGIDAAKNYWHIILIDGANSSRMAIWLWAVQNSKYNRIRNTKSSNWTRKQHENDFKPTRSDIESISKAQSWESHWESILSQI